MTRPTALYDDSGDPVPLGPRLHDSGEAAIYRHGADDGVLIKLHHAPNDTTRQKLAALPALAPDDPSLDARHRNFAWPLSALRNAQDTPVGAILPAVPGARSLTALGNPKLRARRAAEFDWHFLHAVAANTAFLFERLHDQDIVVGDVKPENVMIDDRALATLIDCDSVQVGGHLCTVGSEGFTAPEWIGRRFADGPRDAAADRFGLAVMLFQLLTGAHPWTGEWMGAGDPPSRDTLIRSGDWPYRAGARLRPIPGMVPPDSLSPGLEALFRRAFIAGIKDPDARPDAGEWHEACCLALAELETCETAPHHHYDAGLTECPWCARVAAGLPDPFPAPAEPGDPFAPLILAFERALARGDTRMAVELWHGNPVLARTPDLTRLSPRMAELTAAIEALDRFAAAKNDPRRMAALAEDLPVLHNARLFRHEEIDGRQIADALARAATSALEIPPTPLALPTPAPAPTAAETPVQTDTPTLEIAYRIEGGWQGLRPAQLILRVTKPGRGPALTLTDEAGQVHATVPVQRLRGETRIPFDQPDARVALTLRDPTGTVRIAHPPKRARTLGSPSGMPGLAPVGRFQ